MEVVKVSEALKTAYVSTLSEEMQNKIMAAVDEVVLLGYPDMAAEDLQQCREQAFNSRVCDLDGAIKIEFVPGELSFYVIDNLRYRQDQTASCFKITRFDKLEDAVQAYCAMPKEYTSAIGGSLSGGKFGVGEMDFVHRKNGDDVLVNDFRFSERWDHPLVNEAVQNLISAMHIEYESDCRMFGDKTVLVPLRQPADDHLDSYFMDKYLRPKDGAEQEVARKWGSPEMYSASHPMHSEHLLSAINEVFVEGQGWMKGQAFLEELHSIDEYSSPERLKVCRININYVDMNDRWGQGDLNPHQFALLKKQTVERTAQHPLLDDQIENAQKIRDQKIGKDMVKDKTVEKNKEKGKKKKQR